MPLVFPGSDETHEERDPNEVTFRDGKRMVAPYLAVLMGSLDTERLTYEEALVAVNNGLMTPILNRAMDNAMATLKNRGG